MGLSSCSASHIRRVPIALSAPTAVVTAGQRGDLPLLAQLSVDAVFFDGDEEKIVAHLFKLYAQATA